MEYQYIVVIGNIVDGFAYHGPFDAAYKAVEWAERRTEVDWCVVELDSVL